MDAHRHYGPAALALAIEAWRQGNDVYNALAQAGYAASVASGLAEYVSSSAFSHRTPDEEMSDAKRARTETTGKVSQPVKKYVKSCMDRLVEEKQYQTALATFVPGVAGSVRSAGLGAIVNGTTSVTRVGDIIHVSRLRIAYNVTDFVAGQLRTIVFVDRQANGATPSTSDILTTSNIFSAYNGQTVIGNGGSRFLILYDKHKVVNPLIAATTLDTQVVVLDKKIKIPVLYTASTGAAADISKNNIWVLFISNQATISVNYAPTVYYRDN